MIFLKDKKRIFPLAGAIIVLLLSFSVLYLGDNVGLSDNGDFRRVLIVNNMEYADESNHYYLFKQDYKMKVEGDTFFGKIHYLCTANSDEDIYSSPQFIIIKASKVMNFIVNTVLAKDETDYNIAYLAFIYILMLSASAWGIFTFFADKSVKLRITVFILFIFIFCDAGYLLYFNSLYGEPLQYVSVMLLISLGLLIYKRPTIPKVACFFISLYMFAGSKLANVPYSIVVSLLSLSFIFLRRGRLYKAGVAVCVLVTAVCICKLYISIPEWMHYDTTYQSVFFGAVKESETAEKDLEQLGIDKKYLPLVNTNAYMNADEYPIDITTPEFKTDFYDKISKADVIFFYMRHPVRFIKELAFSIENASSLRPLNTGTSRTVLMSDTNRFSAWSNIRIATKFLYNPYIVFFIAIIMTVYVVMVNIFLVKSKRETDEKRLYMIMALYVLITGLWINMCVPVIGNGEADIMKHMFLFTHCMDILFSAIVMGIVSMKRRNRIISLAALGVTVCALQIEKPREIVEFGTYRGERIKWEIMEYGSDGSMTLVTKYCINEDIFDDENNMWETSDLRVWLNSDFIADFTPEELALILPTRNEVMLTYNDRGLAVSGDHTHYWCASRSEAADLSETAYKYYVDDIVYIPTLDMMKDIDVNGSFWILCPYGYNDKMQRYMKSDGFVLHTNVDNERGVRAAVRIKAIEED